MEESMMRDKVRVEVEKKGKKDYEIKKVVNKVKKKEKRRMI